MRVQNTNNDHNLYICSVQFSDLRDTLCIIYTIYVCGREQHRRAATVRYRSIVETCVDSPYHIYSIDIKTYIYILIIANPARRWSWQIKYPWIYLFLNFVKICKQHRFCAKIYRSHCANRRITLIIIIIIKTNSTPPPSESTPSVWY